MMIRKPPRARMRELLPGALFEHPEGFDLDLHELATNSAQRPEESRCVGCFEIFEKFHDPWRHMPTEKFGLTLKMTGRAEISTDHPGHHITKSRGDPQVLSHLRRASHQAAQDRRAAPPAAFR